MVAKYKNVFNSIVGLLIWKFFFIFAAGLPTANKPNDTFFLKRLNAHALCVFVVGVIRQFIYCDRPRMTNIGYSLNIHKTFSNVLVGI